MKRILGLLLVGLLLISLPTFAQTQSSTKKSPKPIQGKVVSLNEVATGNFQQWTKAEADTAVAHGTPFVFMVGTGSKAKIYFVLNEDGSFAGKKLAKYAFNKKVGIVGKTKVKNGLNFIIAEMIEAME
ncbi:MAG TPA: hypothetical protein P5545_02255 [Bacteroidota bacterium]|nr:hypothetical protein [Candidatus Kapabacteria bacterium]HRS01351.1 hypothetical protein [Bacteroidota bacterium]HRT68027.1 hypothetical protein [Bacteroidota bacterium]